ncbi:MAG: hypothetical protein ACI9OU_002445 [Candidatus Promineifilaceae bacterium]|jgi:hypothetical protein
MKPTHTGNSHATSAGIAVIHVMNMFDDITFIASTLRRCVTNHRRRFSHSLVAITTVASRSTPTHAI